MILAVDAGNSRVKWALHDGDGFLDEGWVPNDALARLDAQWAALRAPATIVVANVAGPVVAQGLERQVARWNVEPVWASSEKAIAGVTNSYEDPTQLGVDRWAALVGARSITQAACVVVNAGTAATIDALSGRGEFLGGLILPGLDLMREALAGNTAKLTAERGEFAAFPRSTRDAITTGALQALCGAAQRLRAEMVSAGHAEPNLVFSGGAGELAARHMGGPARYVEKLVLLGLVRIGTARK